MKHGSERIFHGGRPGALPGAERQRVFRLGGALALLAALLAGGYAAHAVAARVWVIEGRVAFAESELDGVSIDAAGAVSVGPSTTPVFESDSPRMWSFAAAAGKVFVASGDTGQVAVVEEGVARTVFTAPSGPVHALAIGPDGDLYAAIGQPARVFRVDPDAVEVEAEPWIELEDDYVWDLEFAADGRLWLATGTPARVLRVDEAGNIEEIYASSEDHARVLAAHEDGMVLGTAGTGLVAEIDPTGNVFVLFDSPFAEITSLAVADGEIWAGGYGSGEGNGANGSSNGGSAGGGVVRIDADGFPEVVWRDDAVGIQSMLAAADGVLVGTASGGRIYRFEPGGEATLLADVESDRITGLAQTARGVLAATSDSTGLVLLGGPRSTGSLTTPVRDAGTAATWGELRFHADAPAADAVQVYVRSGNTADPGEHWSDWSGPYSRSGERVSVPVARYAQLRITVSGADQDTKLRRLELAYAPRNARPVIAELRVHPGGVVYRESPSFEDGLPFAQLPPSVAARLQEQDAGQGGATLSNGGGSFRGRPLYIAGLRTITWDASDPDGDQLRADLAYRREGAQNWKPLGVVDGGAYTFDTSRVPDGRYEVQLHVTDVLDNPVDAALSATRQSLAFVVDNTAPALMDVASVPDGDGRVRISGRAADAASVLVQLRYSVDGGDWRTVEPADGAADSSSEAFDFAVELPAGGETTGERVHSVVIQAIDAELNRGTDQVLVRQ